MANKYLIEGATYCGDGTASNEAASAGAAGAWNNINVLEGTAPAYGTLAAGDIVYIRSKTSAESIAAAVLAALQATTIPVNIKQVNDVTVQGAGTKLNPWQPV